MATVEQIAIQEDNLFRRIADAATQLGDLFDLPIPTIPRVHRYPAQLRIDQFTAVADFLEGMAVRTEVEQATQGGTKKALLGFFTPEIPASETVAHLQKYAADLGISTTGIKTKKELIEHISAKREEMVLAGIESTNRSELLRIASVQLGDGQAPPAPMEEDEDGGDDE